MRKYLFFPFLCIFFLAGTSNLWAQSRQLSPAELEQKIQKAVKIAFPRTVLVTVSVQMGMSLRHGYGSGAIISPDGYILTCAHVVEIGKTVDITLPSGKVYRAKKLGINPVQDYALLKINPPKPLPYYAIGDSKKLKKGDWVIALGHPGGPYADRKPAVSAGTITGLDRTLYLRKNGKFYNHAIRTDVPIFMGNSGGPLVDLEGKLIGINGAIIFINKNSYAIPIHQIMARFKELKEGRTIQGIRPSASQLGQMRREISPQDMKRIYLRLFQQFYQITIGKAIKVLKKWWKKLFLPKRMK